MAEKTTAGNTGTIRLLKNDISKYKELYNNAPLPYQSLNQDGTIKEVNSAWLKTLGYTRDEVIGKFFGDLLHPDSQSTFERNFPLFKKRGYVNNVQFKIRHKNASYLHIIVDGCIGYDFNGDFDQTYCIFQNITEKKILEDNIAKNQYYLKKAQEIGKIGTWELNLKNNSLIWTEEIYSIFGFPLEYEIAYEDFLNCVYPEDKAYVNEQWLNALNNNSYDIEHRIIVNDKIKWVREKADITYDENGIPISAIGFAQDITDRKEAEAELLESEQRYKTLIDISPDAIFINYNNCITFINPAAIKLFGAKSPNDIIGKSPFDVFHPDYHEKISDRIKLMTETGKSVSQIEEKIIQVNGNIIDVEVIATPFEIAGNKGIQVILRDITERKNIEDTIEKNRKIMQLFIEYAPASIAMFDKNMIYLSVSKRFKHDYRLGNIKIIGKSHYEIFPEISQNWKDIHNRCLKGESAKCDDDPFYRKNGDLDYIKWEIRPWFESPNEIGGIVLFSEVVTDRRNTEAELRKFKSELEEQVEIKTRELKIKVEELERFQDATIDREYRMKELRDENEYLKSLKI